MTEAMSKDSSEVAFLTRLGSFFLPASVVGVSFSVPTFPRSINCALLANADTLRRPFSEFSPSRSNLIPRSQYGFLVAQFF